MAILFENFEEIYFRPLKKQINFFMLIIRFIRLIIELQFLFKKSLFSNIRISKKNNSILTGLCFTKSKFREEFYMENMAGDLIIDDLKFRSYEFYFDLARVKYILKTSLKLNLYSIKEISLVYDIYRKNTNENLFNNYDFYIAIDGVTPVNRMLALIANNSIIKTVKILTNIRSNSNKFTDSIFDIVLLPESSIAKTNPKYIDGWVKMRPNLGKSNNNKVITKIGFIASPLVNPPYISLQALKKLKELSRKHLIIIRKHPQFYTLPLANLHLFLFKSILHLLQIKNIDFSENSLDQFLNEINLLYTDYYSTLNNYAIKENIKVIYFKGNKEKIMNKEYKNKISFKKKLNPLEYYLL